MWQENNLYLRPTLKQVTEKYIFHKAVTTRSSKILTLNHLHKSKSCKQEQSNSKVQLLSQKISNSHQITFATV